MIHKPLDIKIKNERLIENALSTVNGRAYTHTFCSFNEILRIAEIADKKMNDLGMVKTKSVGAQFLAESSGPVANAYDSTRIGTQVIIIRKRDCWALSHIERITLYPQDGGKSLLSLTQEPCVST